MRFMQHHSEFEDASMTSTTLLRGVAVVGDEVSARAFVARYAPMVRAVARACRLSEADADDVQQEVMVAVVEALRRERYDRARGRFRMFLRGVIAHKVRDLIARNQRSLHGPARQTAPNENPGESRLRGADVLGSAPPCPGSASRLFSSGAAAGCPSSPGVAAVHALDELPDTQPSPAQAFEAAFDAEWQKVAMEEAMDVVRREFEPSTFQAFDLCWHKNMPPREVAKLLGISRNAVYLAKGHVLARLKELLDEGEAVEGGVSPRG